MVKGKLKNVKIAGITCAVPTHKLIDSDSFEQFGEKNVKKFVKMTGVKERYISSEVQTSSDLAYIAAEHLLEKLKWTKDSVDGIVFVTQTPDYRAPAAACVLHKRLGLSEDCLAFDVNLGCSGYVYGIHMAETYMQCSDMKRILLLVGDTLNKVISEQDKSSAMLFGEAGSATAIEIDENANDICYILKTRGNGFKAIIVPSGANRNRDGRKDKYECSDGLIRSDYDLYMNGTEVFNFTIDDVPKTINEFRSHFNINDEDIDLYVMHQANLFMLKTIASRANISMDKMPISLDRFGNTSVTSIPLTICDVCERIDIDKNLNLICSGFGVGLSWGVISMSVDSQKCFPIIYTDDYYKYGQVTFDD